MKIRKLIIKIANAIKKIKLCRRGEWTAPQPQEIRSILIAGVTYLVAPFYRDDKSTTAIDKVARLIEKDAESSQ